MALTHLLYLHGFRSSPLSTKAQMTAAAVARRNPDLTWWCPALPPSPREAMEMVLAGLADWPRDSLGVMGSSLGGFYATWLAERLGCKAVLLNPAVHPARDLAPHVGEHALWHQPEQHFRFEAAYVDELRAQEVAAITLPQRYYAVIAKGDEVLDWREMVGHYPGATVQLLPGGDHAISDYADHVDAALDFLGV